MNSLVAAARDSRMSSSHIASLRYFHRVSAVLNQKEIPEERSCILSRSDEYQRTFPWTKDQLSPDQSINPSALCASSGFISRICSSLYPRRRSSAF